jgi:hypothetical protein
MHYSTEEVGSLFGSWRLASCLFAATSEATHLYTRFAFRTLLVFVGDALLLNTSSHK